MGDLLAEGKTRLHGYFFYPHDGLAYFDVEDVVGELLKHGHPLRILHGDLDAGCLESTRRCLRKRAEDLNRPLDMVVLSGHGHVFSSDVKRGIVRFLSEYESKARLLGETDMMTGVAGF